MIWLKLAAAGMVGTGSFCMGYWYLWQYKKRLGLLKELKWFLMLLRGEIEYGRVSLMDACMRAAADSGLALKTAILEMERETDSGGTFSEVFRLKMQETFRESVLREEDLRDFCLWTGDTVFANEQMQVASLNRSIDRLDTTIGKLEQGYEQYRKMTLGLGTLGGCLLLVVLW